VCVRESREVGEKADWKEEEKNDCSWSCDQATTSVLGRFTTISESSEATQCVL